MDVSEYAKANSLGQPSQMVGSAQSVPTLGTVLGSLSDTGAMLGDTADMAERLANQIAGPLPTSDASAKGRRDVDSITDALNERADALRDPAIRIRNALARIERRIG